MRGMDQDETVRFDPTAWLGEHFDGTPVEGTVTIYNDRGEALEPDSDGIVTIPVSGTYNVVQTLR